MFFAAILPVLLIPFILKTMPESMPFLIKKKRDAELRRIVRKLVPDYPLQEHEQFVVPAEDRADERAGAPSCSMKAAASARVMIWIAFFMGLFMVYSLSSWLTKLMAMAGYSLGSALNFVIVFNVGAIVGAVGGGWLGDKFNIKYVLVAFYAVGAASLTLMGYTKSTELLFLVVFIVGASTLGTQLLAYAYAGEFYPTAIRSTGVGFASGVGRIGAILGADPDRRAGGAEAAAGAELHGDRAGGPARDGRRDDDQPFASPRRPTMSTPRRNPSRSTRWPLPAGPAPPRLRRDEHR